MIRNIVTRDLSLSPAIEEKVLKKTEKFDRWFGDEARMEIKFETEGKGYLCEITLQIRRHYYRSEAHEAEILNACETAIDGMERQIRKHKSRMKRRKVDFDYLKPYFADQANAPEEEAEEPRIVRRKSFPIEAMDVEEATLQMALLNHEFFLFLNAETGKAALLYRRKDGDYGLIEPQY
ncbi:MAG: ribosome-associated translation inhibitor RaiA [Eubacteriales bacterium]|nr:ribosome-associated translation inhibitor RaiA [Eubacteriales bacterium]